MGDRLFLYTDGILECTDKGGEEFGYDRLETFLKENIHKDPKVAERLLLETATRFTGGEAFEDDVTLLIAASDTEIPL